MCVWERVEAKLTVMLLLQHLQYIPLILYLLDGVTHLLLHQQFSLVLDLSQFINLFSNVLHLHSLLVKFTHSIIKPLLCILVSLISVFKHQVSCVLLGESIEELSSNAFSLLAHEEFLEIFTIKKLILCEGVQHLRVRLRIILANCRIIDCPHVISEIIRLVSELTVDFAVWVQLSFVHGKAHSMSLVVLAIVPIP